MTPPTERITPTITLVANVESNGSMMARIHQTHFALMVPPIGPEALDVYMLCGKIREMWLIGGSVHSFEKPQ